MNDENIVSFTSARSTKENDNRIWTPRDCLEEFLKEIDEGLEVDRMLIIYGTPEKDDEPEFIGDRVVNASHADRLELLAVSKSFVMKDILG